MTLAKRPWSYLPEDREDEDDESTVLFPAGLLDANGRSVFTVDAGDFDGLSNETARHIVACVNRLAPFTTEQIEDRGFDLFADDRPRLAEAQQDISRLTKQRDQLAAFAHDILGDWPDVRGLDGGDIQDIAVKHGLLVGTVVHEACNGGDPDKPCQCAEFCTDREFAEGVICYRTTELLKGGAA